jgi:hypothetical protein
MAMKFETALNKFESALLKVIDLETKADKEVAGVVTQAFTLLLTVGKETGTAAAEMGDQCEALVAAHLENFRAPKTMKMYVAAFRWAAGRGLLKWNTNLISTEGKIQALTDEGKKVPKELADRAAKTAAEREAKQSKGTVANVENTVKLLAKAYEMAMLIGDSAWAIDIMDTIHAKQPEWKAPSADAK